MESNYYLKLVSQSSWSRNFVPQLCCALERGFSLLLCANSCDKQTGEIGYIVYKIRET